MAAAKKEPTFDDRLRRIEGIVAELEKGDLGLEPAIDRYQEGIALLKDCHAVLGGFRKRVEELTAEAEASLEAYAADPDFAAAEGDEDGEEDS